MQLQAGKQIDVCVFTVRCVASKGGCAAAAPAAITAAADMLDGAAADGRGEAPPGSEADLAVTGDAGSMLAAHSPPATCSSSCYCAMRAWYCLIMVAVLAAWLDAEATCMLRLMQAVS
jgi:hypothetical protein